MTSRTATHAGSWYLADAAALSKQLDQWLDEVPDEVEGVGILPQPHARIIIAPHAGYFYSGSTAAWAYKSLNVSQAKRVFLLGPSHHFYLSKCALSQHSHYETPFGDLKLDSTTISKLQETGKFSVMSKNVDEDEHSLELHLPYIYKILSRSFKTPEEFPLLVPILVGNTNKQTEKDFAKVLTPYLEDPSNVFVISSDFCHWGQRFQYTYYLPDTAAGARDGYSLKGTEKGPIQDPHIFRSIERIDRLCMSFIEGGGHDNFLNIIETTGNTVCGRHPIGIIMAAMDLLQEQLKLPSLEAGFKFVRYARSSDCVTVKDSSVSYASAFGVVNCKDDFVTQLEEDEGAEEADYENNSDLGTLETFPS